MTVNFNCLQYIFTLPSGPTIILRVLTTEARSKGIVTSEAKGLTSEAKAKDLTTEDTAKGLASEAKTNGLTSEARPMD